VIWGKISRFVLNFEPHIRIVGIFRNIYFCPTFIALKRIVVEAALTRL
jgi:hypothetical protein